MPVSVCPHCKTQLWVSNNQMNVANGFVKCSQCSGLLQAKHFLDKSQTERTATLPEAISDAALVSKIGLQIRQYKALSKDEVCNLLVGLPPHGEADTSGKSGQKKLSKAVIADLLDDLHADAKKKIPAIDTQKKNSKTDAKPHTRKSEMNWTLAVMVALTVLILQLFYLLLMN